MKKIISLLAVIFIVADAAAQFQTNLVLSATPPAQLSDWGNRKEVLTFIVNAGAGLTPTFKIKSEIKTTDGTVIGTTDLANARTFTSSTATSLFYATDVLPLEYMIFTGKYKSSLAKTGKLPADNYILCVQLVRPTDFTPASQQTCKNFYLASLQLPILMKPSNGEVLDEKTAQTAITFRWTPVVPRPSTPVTYRIQVFEVMENQNPMQALRSNQPLLDKEIRGTTQFIWRPQLMFKEEVTDSLNNKNRENIFIWTIQSLDDRSSPIVQTDGSGEARSEPFVFKIKNKDAKKPKSN